MTLVHNDKVEEIRRKQFAVTSYHFIGILVILFVFVSGKLLIKREVDLMGSNSRFIILVKIDLMNHLFKG